MTRIKFISYTIIGVLNLSLSSCSDSFLEVDPKGRILAKEVVDYRNLFYNNNLLSNGSSAEVQIAMGDDATAFSDYLASAQEYTQRGFRWEQELYTEEQDAGEFTSLMAQVYVLNKIANEVGDAEGGTVAEKQLIAAEARATRAWHYFMLINYYGKPYDVNTASTDPGFPIVTEADVAIENYTRASVQQVYDFMINDITESIPLLPQNTDVRTRITLAAAEALLGKIYLFMGKYEEALVQFNLSFSHLPTSFEVGLFNYNETLTSGGAWYYAPTINSYTGAPLPWRSLESLFARQIQSQWVNVSNEILLNPETYALFGSDDKRALFFTRKPGLAAAGTVFPTPNVYRKYAPSSSVAYGITMPDLYLMRAECEARVGSVDRALVDLHTLRSKRTSEAQIFINDRTQLIRFIIDERRREFALQGFRWFDMRRLSKDPLFANTVYTHVLYNSTGEVQERFTLSPARLTLRLPAKVRLYNPDMPENP
ncbi:RagB/SusD family nutrient uptake outer membrane protein [Sphingobacterium olei]|uniref:RagB/SusD family nutrient uptake outer membrane protein n=1 Tax=Sphingobacterium olei TaxID=2571155 RepID=A0A4U0P2I6_9SPHI|nr:RagB/SusD family nutrient uptake outer membrane protein [Sphingobacterium olei]TJZ61517.1 RagB/SusD family nutrient uptake outer membrane protein [Sphingobacterium olei]